MKLYAKDMDKVTQRIIKEAYEFFDGYGIDFTQYGKPELHLDLGENSYAPGYIVWTHKTSGNELILSSIWVDRKTGEIKQAGSHDFGL